MRKRISWIIVSVITAALGLLGAHVFSKAVTVLAENQPVAGRCTIIIDAGHGEPDGGAVSCTGRLESTYNLEIATRLNDFLQLLGHKTTMVRSSEVSVYTEGKTIAAKKVSDLKERVRIVNDSDNGLLLSIHQNYFQDSRYHGAVVLYANSEESKKLAGMVQDSLVASLNPGSNRKCKKADGVYLMKHIQCPGILVECGFLSNIQEEAMLRDPAYQRKLCSVIGCTVNRYLYEKKLLDSNISG